MAQSLFKKIKERQPDGTIDVVAPAWSLPVIERMPEVRSGIVLDVGHGELGFSKRRRLGIELRSSEYDRAIVLPRSLKAALVPWFARIPIRTGFRGETRIGLINDTRLFDRHRLNQTVKRFVALGLSNGTVPERVPYPELTVQPERRHDVIAPLGIGDRSPGCRADAGGRVRAGQAVAATALCCAGAAVARCRLCNMGVGFGKGSARR